ncbi:MAG: hypothetical protein K5857_05995 [Lachnospiraceae bacterium]|nr:hypothetical protein [Lachnospiraceae bacterium]
MCDPDRDYALALCEYIRRNECGLEVVMYTDPYVFFEEMREGKTSLLLIEEGFLAELDRLFDGEGSLNNENMGRCFVLTGDEETARAGENRIYKYRSARNIISIIGDDLEHKHRIADETLNKQGVRLIGVYSPVNHTLKTTLAMTLGQILAEKEKVLYINLEGYSGLFEMLDIRTEVSLLDLMYEYSLNREDLANILCKYTLRMDELDVLIPARSPFELQEVEPGLWLSLLSDLTGGSRYSAIILDISDAVRGTLDIMNVCTGIYTPLRKDAFSMAKFKDFTDMLTRCPGGENLALRINKLRFPYFEDIDGTLSDLKHSRLARYIRDEICNEKET